MAFIISQFYLVKIEQTRFIYLLLSLSFLHIFLADIDVTCTELSAECAALMTPESTKDFVTRMLTTKGTYKLCSFLQL